MPKRQSDARQLTLEGWVDLGAGAPASPGNLSLGPTLCRWIAEAIEQSGKDRYAIAAELSRLTGDDIAKTTVDAWTAQAKRKWRMPLEYLPALIEATGQYWLLEKIAEAVGCRVLLAAEHVYYRLGKLEEESRRLKAQREYLSRLTTQDAEGGL